jgi:hypothetical protein
MGRYDDESILPVWTLARGVRVDWLESDYSGNETIQSRAFDESNQEVSCFILDEIGGHEGFRANVLPIIESEIGRKLRFATIDVGFVRSCGFWIYRKAEEFHDNPAHVVICPGKIENISRNQFKKQARELAKHAVLQPLDPGHES